MPKRKNKPPSDLRQEESAITHFVLSEIVPNPEARGVWVSEMFEAYKAYRKRHGLDPTVLNVDGFGRMFPSVYPRTRISKPCAGKYKTLRGVAQVELRRHA